MTGSKVPLAPPSILSEAGERLLAHVAFEAVWERDLQSDTVTWNGSLEPIFGYEPAEGVNDISWWRERVHPDDLELVEPTASQPIPGDAPGSSNASSVLRQDT